MFVVGFQTEVKTSYSTFDHIGKSFIIFSLIEGKLKTWIPIMVNEIRIAKSNYFIRKNILSKKIIKNTFICVVGVCTIKIDQFALFRKKFLTKTLYVFVCVHYTYHIYPDYYIYLYKYVYLCIYWHYTIYNITYPHIYLYTYLTMQVCSLSIYLIFDIFKYIYTH